MIKILERTRKAEKDIPLSKHIIRTLGIILLGFALGVLQKWMDEMPDNVLPVILQTLDIRNYFGRFAVWILLATVISVYSRSPLKAAVNTFTFFISMLAGYYIYCNFVLGFLPRAYMMMWIGISFITPFMAYICWYAKGKGPVAIVSSGVIIGVLFAQAFSIIQGFYVYSVMDVITWLISIVILFRKPKETAMEIGISFVTACLCQLFVPNWLGAF